MFGMSLKIRVFRWFLTYFLGLDDWSDTDVLTQVLAASQQEYLDSLKQAKEQETASQQQQQNSKSRRSSSDSNQDKNNAS